MNICDASLRLVGWVLPFVPEPLGTAEVRAVQEIGPENGITKMQENVSRGAVPAIPGCQAEHPEGFQPAGKKLLRGGRGDPHSTLDSERFTELHSLHGELVPDRQRQLVIPRGEAS